MFRMGTAKSRDGVFQFRKERWEIRQVDTSVDTSYCIGAICRLAMWILDAVLFSSITTLAPSTTSLPVSPSL
jgi:hypothetical protein